MGELSFFLAEENGPFVVSLVAMLAIGVIEVLGLVLGLGIGELVDDFLPDLSEFDAGGNAGEAEFEGSFFTEAFSWLNAGRVPYLILLMVFLGAFTIIGYGLQLMVGNLGFLLPAVVAGPIAFLPSLPATRMASAIFGRVLPREETYAVSENDLIGRLARITFGPVTLERAGQAKVIDTHGNPHFVRLRAAEADKEYQVHQEVLLVAVSSGLFDAIDPPASLQD